ncbi:hypothetical protein Tco_1037301, partial [Tanacetum coccineum]
LGSLRALKANAHHVIAIFTYPLGAVDAACALEVDAIRALDLMKAVRALDRVEVEAVVAFDVVGLSLNILISASLSGYLTSLYKTKSSSPKKTFITGYFNKFCKLRLLCLFCLLCL